MVKKIQEKTKINKFNNFFNNSKATLEMITILKIMRLQKTEISVGLFVSGQEKKTSGESRLNF